jgi:hypothetical protein
MLMSRPGSAQRSPIGTVPVAQPSACAEQGYGDQNYGGWKAGANYSNTDKEKQRHAGPFHQALSRGARRIISRRDCARMVIAMIHKASLMMK